jgi:transmembrane sensor
MKYDPYSLTELIRNDDFIAWVLHPDVELEMQWNIFLLENPEKKSTVESAREYVILLAQDTGRHMPTPQQSDKMRRMVEESIHSADREKEIIPLIPKWRWMRITASIAVILGAGTLGYWFYSNGNNRPNDVSDVATSRIENLIEQTNETGTPVMVLLPDGSSVVLDPGASLSFTKDVKRNRREVTLRGKAFFEISKDSQKPFLVYTHGLVTRVLGTSFLIDATEEDVKVEVKTGLVRVFSVKNLTDSQKQEFIEDPASHGILLAQDQGIAFSKEHGEIVKLPDQQVSSVETNRVQMFVFEETPVEQVFKQIEATYNVKIIYDQASWAGFPLNATLTGRPFISKLEVICNALDATFTIHQNEITIKANTQP